MDTNAEGCCILFTCIYEVISSSRDLSNYQMSKQRGEASNMDK